MSHRAGSIALLVVASLGAQEAPSPVATTVTVLRPARVFDGNVMHDGWAVRVRGERIEAVGPAASVASPGATSIDMPGATLLPGLIEGHSHVLLHPYNETTWNDQVLHEGLALRVARATNHLRATLMAGFTTIRDLGTEGAAYADAELKQAVEQGIVPGPRMLVATRAIVATGSYAPKGFAPEWRVPQGAEEADGDSLIRVVRDQIAAWSRLDQRSMQTTAGALTAKRPTFSVDELKTIVATAQAADGRLSPTPPPPRGCAARFWRGWRRSNTAMPERRKCSP